MDTLPNSLIANANSSSIVTPDTSPRGVKRSRSPTDNYGDLPQTGDGGADDGMYTLWNRETSDLCTMVLARCSRQLFD
jgi:hypothetical protein